MSRHTEISVDVHTKTLLSKWGLDDGDILDPDLRELGFDLAVVNTGDILVELIRDHVLPRIENKIEYEIVNTMHNPIRITHVDGGPIDNCRPDSHSEVTLRPEVVRVSNDIIYDCAARWLRGHKADQ